MLQHPSYSFCCLHHLKAAISAVAVNIVPSSMPGTFSLAVPEKVVFLPKECRESVFHHGR